MRVKLIRRAILLCTFEEFSEMRTNHTVFCTECGHLTKDPEFYEIIYVTENVDEAPPDATECLSCRNLTARTVDAASGEGLVIIEE